MGLGSLATKRGASKAAPSAALLAPLALQLHSWWGLAPVWAAFWVVKLVHAMVRWRGLLF